MDRISIVVPCFNEQEVLRLFYDETASACKDMDAELEFVFIDDGSRDNTLAIMRELAGADARVKYLSFSKNFGKEAGIYAGLTHATGDYIVLMDADLQHPPSLIPKMYETIKREGCDSAAAKRVVRTTDSALRRMFSRWFFKLMRSISSTDLVAGATDFRMMTRQVADAVRSLSEYNRFTKGIFGWVGFTTVWLDYEDVERAAGETKWTLRGLMRYSVEGVISFSTRPLAIASVLGLIFCAVSILLLIYFALKTWLLGGDPVAGFPTLICVIFLLGGIQLLCFGILGQYVAKMYLETKHRPIYIEKESNIRP